MNLSFFEESELEFGAGRHIDIRFGVMAYGPLDFESPLAPRQINVGIIGSKETIEGTREWLNRCRSEIPCKNSKQPNLFPRFPGFNQNAGFRSTLVIENNLCRDIAKSALADVVGISDLGGRIERCVELFLEEIKYLAQNTEAKVILCALPLQLLSAMNPGEADEPEDGGEPLDIAGTQPDFHDMLKARSMQLYHKPIQLILPSTYDERLQRKQNRAGRKRTLQDEATRAWNIHSALYYKAGGVPWRLLRDSTELTTCYVGISFYRSLDQSTLLTSVAQVFNERGEGVVVRGGAATISKDDRQAHLPEKQAFQLIENALRNYRDVHKTLPARVVMHKSSRFDENEMRGFNAALKAERVTTADMLSIGDSTTRLFRAGVYPPLRGTLLTADDAEMVLYTRGSVDFFETYPGKYIPVPLRIRCDSTEQTQKFLAREILGLTKMNWNNTQFDGSEPVTLRASRQCSSVIRYCAEGQALEPRYSFYM
jgi:hypothetical protein